MDALNTVNKSKSFNYFAKLWLACVFRLRIQYATTLSGSDEKKVVVNILIPQDEVEFVRGI